MSKMVLRETIPVDDAWHTLEIHGPIVHVAARGEDYVEIWFLADTAITNWARTLRAFGTGQTLPDLVTHVGTAVTPSGRLVWHLFESMTGGTDG